MAQWMVPGVIIFYNSQAIRGEDGRAVAQWMVHGIIIIVILKLSEGRMVGQWLNGWFQVSIVTIFYGYQKRAQKSLCEFICNVHIIDLGEGFSPLHVHAPNPAALTGERNHVFTTGITIGIWCTSW